MTARVRPCGAAIVAFALVTSGCASSTRTAAGFDGRFEPGETVLLLDPDVELSRLSASGLAEPRADWSEAAVSQLGSALEPALRERGLEVIDGVSGRDLAERHTQLFELKDAVMHSIRTYSYDPDDRGTPIVVPGSRATLPTKRDAFNWTLGPGAAALAEGRRADFALFVTVRGSYESGGRILLNGLLQTLQRGKVRGGAKQMLFASLVELETGAVLWTNLIWLGQSVRFNLREPTGAGHAVSMLLGGMPS